MPADNLIISDDFHAGLSYRDEESGLLNGSYFRSLLRKLNEKDYWEKSLSLIFLELPSLNSSQWRIFGQILNESFRQNDLAARLSKTQVTVFMPDADSHYLRQWLHAFFDKIDNVAALKNLNLNCGWTVARLKQGQSLEEFATKPVIDPNDHSFLIEKKKAEVLPESLTAIAEGERELLFAGFKMLDSQ